MNTHMSLDYAGDQMWVPNIVRAIGQALLLAPLAAVAMVGIAAQELGAASGVFNMMRNLGGAFGTAILATIVTKREQYQSNIIGSSVTLFMETVRDRVAHLTSHGAWQRRRGCSTPSSSCRSREDHSTAIADPGL